MGVTDYRSLEESSGPAPLMLSGWKLVTRLSLEYILRLDCYYQVGTGLQWGKKQQTPPYQLSIFLPVVLKCLPVVDLQLFLQSSHTIHTSTLNRLEIPICVVSLL